MIQRIQSVYLLLGALAMAGLLLLGRLWQGAPADTYGWFAPVVAGLAGLTSLGALITIFLYNNRPRQRTFTAGLQVLTALVTILLFGGYYWTNALNVTAGGETDLVKIALLALPVVAYVLFLLARRAIRSDIELVKSMDRLR